MSIFKKFSPGILLTLAIAFPAWYMGKIFPVIGAPVFAILLGLFAAYLPIKESYRPGINFTSKKILQLAIVFLGFGMNMMEIYKVGAQSLTIILSTISTSLIVSFIIAKMINIPSKAATLIGVGSSICGGSAVAATAPVIAADDEDVAKAISVIFLFNVVAALIFPILGRWFGFSDIGFGMWAGTAINDTSSVVAAGQTWANFNGSDTALNYATIVKLTRTLAIIPITLILALYRSFNEKSSSSKEIKLSRIFPWFILYFVIAAIISTAFSIPKDITKSLTQLSKFFITMAMSAIGLNTDFIKLVKTGGKPILLGLCCWVSIALVSLFMQRFLGIW